MMNVEEAELTYQVVMNAEEQYSIWPSYKKRPPGWADVGPTGNKADCLAWIEKTWLDMRPRSLREAMQADAPQLPARPIKTEGATPLPARLCQCEQAVRVARCADAADFKAQLDRGYVLLEFTQTSGGTEIGCPVSSSKSFDATTRLDSGVGKVEFEARVRLDHEPLLLRALIDLVTLEGVCSVARAPEPGATH